jgi:hypothetical protein
MEWATAGDKTLWVCTIRDQQTGIWDSAIAERADYFTDNKFSWQVSIGSRDTPAARMEVMEGPPPGQT